VAARGARKVRDLARNGAGWKLLLEQRGDCTDERDDAPDTARKPVREKVTHRQNDGWREATTPQPRQCWRCGP